MVIILNKKIKIEDDLNVCGAKFLDIFEIILPFFQEYNIRGVKSLDFLNWCEIAEMMKNKEHLTQEGLDKIKKIKENMNKSRKIN